MAVTNIFSPNTRIKSAEVNQNFADVYPVWATWTPAFLGFSANPTVTSARYCLVGKLCIVTFKQNANGTSNSTGFVIQGFPVAFKYINTYPMMGCFNNGVSINTGVGVVTAAAGTDFTLFLDHVGNVWTASGTKGVDSFTLVYEVA